MHEMGHVLGIGGYWHLKCGRGCLANPPDHTYDCFYAKDEYNKLVKEACPTLYVENDGGAGTKCVHWDEACFNKPGNSELMTGIFEENLKQPISVVSAAALVDLGGYGGVNYKGCDPYPMPDDSEEGTSGFPVYAMDKTLKLHHKMDEDGTIYLL